MLHTHWRISVEIDIRLLLARVGPAPTVDQTRQFLEAEISPFVELSAKQISESEAVKELASYAYNHPMYRLAPNGVTGSLDAIPQRREESNLLKFAKEEMRRAGLYGDDADYGAGEIAHAVERLVEVFSDEGHSGASAHMALAIFEKLAQWKPLSPLTSNPEEWMEVQDGQVWQNRRCPSAFSNDGGATWYDIDDPKREVVRGDR